MTWKFSRSHQEALHQCPRLCWLRYYDRGHGWETRRLDLHRATGTLSHEALELILKQVAVYDAMPSDELVDMALKAAVAKYKRDAAERGFDLEQVGDSAFEMQRQASLAEGLVRAWIRIRLPSLLTEYRVLECEQEWEVALDGAGEIVIMVRLDALLERRSDQELWPIEFKTTGWMSDDWLESWRYSTQTLQQVWAVEKHTGRPCGGVLVEVLYKGVKRSDEVKGITYYSPLIRGYIKRGVPPFDQDELSWDSAVGKRKGWEPVDVWQWGAVKDWIALLPEEVLTAQLFSREVFRSGKEMETWERQTLVEQRRIAKDVKIMTDHPDNEELVQMIMDETFAARLNADCYSNKYRQRCQFLDVCYNNVDPADDERFVPRVPHHKGEWDKEEE